MSFSKSCIWFTWSARRSSFLAGFSPRSTRRKKAYGKRLCSIFSASSSLVTLGTLRSLAYSGESTALIAALPLK